MFCNYNTAISFAFLKETQPLHSYFLLISTNIFLSYLVFYNLSFIFSLFFNWSNKNKAWMVSSSRFFACPFKIWIYLTHSVIRFHSHSQPGGLRYVKSVRIRNFTDTYSVRMLENTDQKNSEYRHILRSISIDTRSCFNIYKTSIRLIDVETMSCVYWDYGLVSYVTALHIRGSQWSPSKL